MKEIKFRGKRISDGDWFYGDLITEVDGDYNLKNVYIHIRLSKVDFSEDSSTSKLCLHEVDPETVGQYTGLKDKNGKEIYDNDIFKAPHDFGPGGFDVRQAVVRWHEIKGYQWEYWLLDQLEVIGNIYENPELLEETP